MLYGENNNNMGKIVPQCIAGIALRKKIKSFAVPLANLALSFAIVNSATEKTLSKGADVAGMQRILDANVDNNKYFLVFNCHHEHTYILLTVGTEEIAIVQSLSVWTKNDAGWFFPRTAKSCGGDFGINLRLG
jgi:hypothetical protein